MQYWGLVYTFCVFCHGRDVRWQGYNKLCRSEVMGHAHRQHNLVTIYQNDCYIKLLKGLRQLDTFYILTQLHELQFCQGNPVTSFVFQVLLSSQFVLPIFFNGQYLGWKWRQFLEI